MTFAGTRTYLTARNHPGVPDVDAFVAAAIRGAIAHAEDGLVERHPAGFWRTGRLPATTAASDFAFDVSPERSCRP